MATVNAQEEDEGPEWRGGQEDYGCEEEEDGLGTFASLALGEDTHKDGFIDKKRQRQLRRKPGWYRKRSQHISKGAKKKLQQLGHIFCIDSPAYGSALDLQAIFQEIATARKEEGGGGAVGHLCPETAKVILEVGFGHGDTLVELARRTREQALFVGSEWHRASLGHCIQKLNETGLNEQTNVRILKGDFMHQIRAGFYGEEMLDEVCVFFPDPWSHEVDKPRRIINPEMVSLIWRTLRPGGFLHIATDVKHYAIWVGEVMEKAAGWEACPAKSREESVLVQSIAMAPEGGGGFGDVPSSTADHIHEEEDVKDIYGLLPKRPLWRPLTHYERRGIEELGHQIYDFCFRKENK